MREDHFPAGDRFDVQPSISNHFSWLRTRMGLERTLMAWMRTSVSLIGFGFTIVQFFQRLKGMESAGTRPVGDHAPRDLGLALIATGVGALAISTWQYHLQLKYLWSPAFKGIAGVYESPHRTPVFIAALVLMVVGIAAFSSVFIHIL